MMAVIAAANSAVNCSARDIQNPGLWEALSDEAFEASVARTANRPATPVEKQPMRFSARRLPASIRWRVA
jgi:hypothetical protein